ncbi:MULTISPECIES: WD40/YVTN/BNR-like repeat-containing protein [Actinomadura]|uniref:WD40/YVTN/BNR-like repeat-containing protein n=1 Tax=Actinomadura yumaensis TaxID=111807 RepID=A0ABW2CCC7_9ACTN|nr:hypothetical protein [Actinomadura sp. J1-007]MWK33439.1 hypothetical protein [Actinomadura sp. J1-007]
MRSGIAVAAVAALVAGGAVYLLRDGGSGGDAAGGGKGGEGGARDASGIFAVQPALYDGHEQSISGVAVRGGVAVTVGSETVDRPRGQFLVSADGGQGWALGNVEPPGDPADVPRVVAAGAKTWAALGDGPSGVATWTSADGRTWTPRAGDKAVFTAGDKVTAVAATASGFAAVGTSGQGQAVLWTSPDGTAWTRTTPSLPGVRPERLAASGDTLVLQSKGEVWRSADAGRTWSRAEIPQSDGSYGSVVGLAAGPGGFFAAREGRRTSGSSKHPKRRGLAVFFRSADGVSWARSSTIDRRTYARLAAFGGSDAGLAVLIPLTDGRVAVQRSGDGVTWDNVERLPGDGGRKADGTAALPKGVLVAGRQDTGAYLAAPGARHGDIDLLGVPGAVTPDRTVARLASGGGTTLAVGSGGGDAAVWTTRDGASWTRAGGTGLAGPGLQRITAAAYGPKGWVAAGRGANRTRPLLLTSADGAAWNTAAGVPAFKDGELTGAAYGPRGYVVAGPAGTWRSDDLTSWHAGTGDVKGAEPRDVAAVSSGYVAVGEDGDGKPAVWTSPDGGEWSASTAPALPAGTSFTQVVARGDTLTALASGNGRAAVAVSSDAGRTWRAQPLQASELTAALAGPRGFVVAGSPAGGSDVALWASADGTSWRTIRPRGRGLDGDGAQRLTALTAQGDGLLAVGTDGATPTLWHTPLP